MDVVERVLSREINPAIVKGVEELRGKARGFSGADIFKCRKLWLNDRDKRGAQLDIGFVGEVTSLNTEPLRECIRRSITPVISPTALGEDGQIYNCNADVAAAQVAIALKAKRLVFMSDVPGLLRNPRDPDSVIPHLKIAEVDKLKRAGIIDAGMIPKVDSAVEALMAGVDKVSFVDGRVAHSVLLEIFTDEGVGTEIVL
jgi:acetylglutamate kinase